MPLITGSLLQEGAIVDVLVGLSRAEVNKLRLALRPVPLPMQVRALIDSGAEVSCLDPAIIQRLALPWDRPTLANMPGAVGMVWASLYAGSLTILHPSGDPNQNYVVPALPLCELPLGILGYDAVIGRDILDGLRFLYDGPGRTFSLDY
jgi:hypothetical protein